MTELNPNQSTIDSETQELLELLRTRTWAFMGTPQIAVDFLERLHTAYDIRPNLTVTNPDKKTGRKQTLTPSPIKAFSEQSEITCLTPEKPAEIVDVLLELDFVLVFAYHHILPQEVLDAPKHGILNIHPSLLPSYRGPSPIMSAILADDKQTGVTIIQLDHLMDHGPIVSQIPYTFFEWQRNREVEQILSKAGADLFVQTINGYLDRYIIPEEQNHERASYCKKFTKADMEIDRTAPPYDQYLTYCAFPKPFFYEGGTRIVVTQAEWLAEFEQFVIKRVIPEGKKEIDFIKLKIDK